MESSCAYLLNQHGRTEERNVLHRVLSKNCNTETMHDTIFSNNSQLIMWAFLIIFLWSFAPKQYRGSFETAGYKQLLIKNSGHISWEKKIKPK